jgi:hypothetical protein
VDKEIEQELYETSPRALLEEMIVEHIQANQENQDAASYPAQFGGVGRGIEHTSSEWIRLFEDDPRLGGAMKHPNYFVRYTQELLQNAEGKSRITGKRRRSHGRKLWCVELLDLEGR